MTNYEILPPQVKSEEGLRNMRSEGVFEAFVESTGTIWKYSWDALDWKDTGKRPEVE